MREFYIALLASLLAAAAAQPRPKPWETYEVDGYAQFFQEGANFVGEMFLAADPQAGKFVANATYGGFTPERITQLYRADLNAKFFMSSLVTHNNCWRDELNGEKIPEWWDWLDKAQFAHNITNIEGKTFNIWSYDDGCTTRQVGVPAEDPNTLVYYSWYEATSKYHFQLYVLRFSATRPESSVFDLPKECIEQPNDVRPHRPLRSLSPLPFPETALLGR